VVLGSSSRTDLPRIPLGSVSNRLLHMATRPHRPRRYPGPRSDAPLRPGPMLQRTRTFAPARGRYRFGQGRGTFHSRASAGFGKVNVGAYIKRFHETAGNASLFVRPLECRLLHLASLVDPSR
jgi:hypothetical protein